LLWFSSKKRLKAKHEPLFEIRVFLCRFISSLWRRPLAKSYFMDLIVVDSSLCLELENPV
jgi:hypothetical protein